MVFVAKRRVKTTKLDIVRYATSQFLERGYSPSSLKQIAQDLDMGTGHLTYYFPTKEHLLAVLTDLLCQFQWELMKREADDGLSSVMAICLELSTMAAVCEADEAAKDFFLSTYASPMCLDIIRRNDTARAKTVFREYCPDWTDDRFAAAEVLVSGLEYATLMTSGDPLPLPTRISGALDNILRIYNVPEETRKTKISRVLAMDYRAIGQRLLMEFKQFVERTHDQALEELYKSRQE